MIEKKEIAWEVVLRPSLLHVMLFRAYQFDRCLPVPIRLGIAARRDQVPLRRGIQYDP
jgi:hypothetical protein